MKKPLPSIFVFMFIFLSANVTVLFAQRTGGSPISLHVNCASGCDENYIRQEINYLNHVRDLGLADVQLFINQIRSGSGGRVYELSYTGKNDFEGISQELTYETNPNQTWDEIRAGLLKRIEVGLLPYLLRAGLEGEIDIDIDYVVTGEETTTSVEVVDPWDFWIFEVRGSGNLQKESQRNEFNLEIGGEADRVTEEWKYGGDIEFNFSQSRFNSDEEQFVSIRNRHFLRVFAINSLGRHWSVGLFSDVSHNTFRNMDLSVNVSPALEYSIYPYVEAIRREITLVYRFNYERNDYIEETIYGRMQESLFRQSLTFQSRFRQPWGNLFASLEASNYLHDFSKNRVQLDGFIDVRLFQGFSLRVSTEIELIRDLITLPAGESSLEDILLRQRQIATDFTMELGVGISYIFGSAFNSIVNPRL